MKNDLSPSSSARPNSKESQEKNCSEEFSFGFEKVSASTKRERVNTVFSNVANEYDLMNDLMSLGTHRLFKRMLVEVSGINSGDQILDLAGGTGDVADLIYRTVGNTGHITLADPNLQMIEIGRNRLLDAGACNVSTCVCTAEELPFRADTFDKITLSFGFRNFTNQYQALSEMRRILKPGGSVTILEFTKPKAQPLKNLYAQYRSLWPKLGEFITGDKASYTYLNDSIEVHLSQEALVEMFRDAGYVSCFYTDLLGGVAAIHKGTKPINDR